MSNFRPTSASPSEQLQSVGVTRVIDEPAFGCAAGEIRFDDAVEHVLRLAPSRLRTETVALAQCAGRVIAAPLDALLDLPGFDRSAMDGVDRRGSRRRLASQAFDLSSDGGVNLGRLFTARGSAIENPCSLSQATTPVTGLKIML